MAPLHKPCHVGLLLSDDSRCEPINAVVDADDVLSIFLIVVLFKNVAYKNVADATTSATSADHLLCKTSD